jgi:hypothetical protein
MIRWIVKFNIGIIKLIMENFHFSKAVIVIVILVWFVYVTFHCVAVEWCIELLNSNNSVCSRHCCCKIKSGNCYGHFPFIHISDNLSSLCLPIAADPVAAAVLLCLKAMCHYCQTNILGPRLQSYSNSIFTGSSLYDYFIYFLPKNSQSQIKGM